MQRLIFILLIFSGCATAPQTGYIDGVLDSGVLAINNSDSIKEKKIKVIAQKVITVAKQEIKIAKQATADANKKLEKSESARKWFLFLIAGGLITIAVLIKMIQIKINITRKP